jgi:hypothetical protein
MLHGRRLDHALEHVNGSRYALVHAVAKRARQITLWLTADPAELRAESAPPPMSGESSISRDPVALSEAEILDGEVIVRWDPDGQVDERELLVAPPLETDPLLLEGLDGDDDDDVDGDDEAETLTPALAQALDTEVPAASEEAEVEVVEDAEEADIDTEDLPEAALDVDDIQEVSLEEVDEGDEDEDEPGE